MVDPVSPRLHKNTVKLHSVQQGDRRRARCATSERLSVLLNAPIVPVPELGLTHPRTSSV